MNIGIMLKTIQGRIKCEEFHPITINNALFFQDRNDWMTDLLLLSSFWNELENEDKLIISQLIIGVRHRQEFMLLMRWISENKDIDNFTITCELDYC